MKSVIIGLVGAVAGFCAGVQSVPPATLTLESGSIVRNISTKDVKFVAREASHVLVERIEMSFTPAWLFQPDCVVCVNGGSDQVFRDSSFGDVPTVAELLLELVGVKRPSRPCAVIGGMVYESCDGIPRGRFDITEGAHQ